MPTTVREGLRQIGFLYHDIRVLNKGHAWGWLTCWFYPPAMAVARYRSARCLHLTLGRGWRVLHTALLPLLFLVRPWTRGCDISPHAAIGKGLRIAYPSLGVVIHDAAVVGENLYLVGGNCIGGKRGSMRPGEIVIGDDVTLGANAVVLGPIRIGNNVMIAAGAVVVHDAADNDHLVGVPARPRPRSGAALDSAPR